MMSYPFWLSDEAWSLIEPMLPKNQPGARRVDDRRVLSGIFLSFKAAASGVTVRATIYNRFNRGSHCRIWQPMLDALTAAGHLGGTVAVDSTYVKAHRSAAGAKKKKARIKRLASRAADARPRSTSPPTSSDGRSPFT